MSFLEKRQKRQATLCMSVCGTIFGFVRLDETDFKILHMLELHVKKACNSDVTCKKPFLLGMTPRLQKLDHNNMIDGDLLSSFLEMDVLTQQQILKDFSAQEHSLGSILKKLTNIEQRLL